MKMLQHSAIYLLARILAGAASFISIAVFSRLLDADDFGRVTLALSGASLFGAILTTGPNLAMQRFLPQYANLARGTALWGMIIPGAIVCIAAAFVAWPLTPVSWRGTIPFVALLIVSMAIYEFQIAAAQGQLQPWRYAFLGAVKALIGTLCSVVLVVFGWGVTGVLLGAAIGLLASVLGNVRGWWIGRGAVDALLWRRMAIFAWPLSGIAALNWVAAYSDRWLLAYFCGFETAGQYAVAYDLTFQALVFSSSVVTLAGDPLTITSYTKDGAKAAREQLKHLGGMLVALLLPSLVGLLLAGPLLVRLMVGETYRETTLSLLPLLATAIFVNCLMIYPTYACKLTSRTDIWFFTIVVTAVSNVLLNVILIPRYQALGAVLSTLAAYSVGLVLLIANARRLFPLPFPEPIIVLAAALGTLFMAAWLWPFHQVTHWSALFYVIPGAMIIYAGVYAIVVTAGRTGLSKVFPMN